MTYTQESILNEAVKKGHKERHLPEADSFEQMAVDAWNIPLTAIRSIESRGATLKIQALLNKISTHINEMKIDHPEELGLTIALAEVYKVAREEI